MKCEDALLASLRYNFTLLWSLRLTRMLARLGACLPGQPPWADMLGMLLAERLVSRLRRWVLEVDLAS